METMDSSIPAGYNEIPVIEFGEVNFSVNYENKSCTYFQIENPFKLHSINAHEKKSFYSFEI